MVLFGISLGAMAGYEGKLIDPKGGDGDCIKIPDDFNDEGSYAIYFKTGEAIPTAECVSYFQKVKQELAELADGGNIAYFVVVGIADKQGDANGYPNDVLSGRRVDYLVNNILPSGVARRTWAAGSSDDRVNFPYNTATPLERSVYIYPVWARFECDAKLVSDINSNIAKLEKAKGEYPKQATEIDKILDNYNKAHLLCDEEGKKLGAGDAEDLTNYLNGAIVLINKSGINFGITDITISSTDIDTHYYNLSRMRDSLKLSVWRDENGNFNTARLVSDSIAGVVLGTVGGIVTANLVKKAQVKQGFEDIGCYIGGQSVADYGDEFNVGR